MSLRIEPWVVALVELCGRTRLHALALQCHAIAADGRLRPLEHAPDDVLAPDDQLQWRPEDDLAPCKPCTDVVVVGSAWAPGGVPVRRMLARVAVAEVGASASVLVVGERRVVREGDTIAFGEPAPFQRMPLDWRRAYGGPPPQLAGAFAASADGAGDRSTPPLAADAPADASDDVLADFLHQRAARHGHPRNPVGRGFGLQRGRAGSATGSCLDGGGLLPNFEDPDDPLDPERWTAARAWARQPIPRGFGWLAPTWFPRSRRFEPPSSTTSPAAVPGAGWPDSRVEPGEHGGLAAQDHVDPAAPFAWSSGAAPGLAMPWLEGGETLDMIGLSPRGRSLVRLPRPRATRARLAGQELDARWRIHTVCIDVDRGLLSVVWRAELALPARLVRTIAAGLGEAPRADALVLEADLAG